MLLKEVCFSYGEKEVLSRFSLEMPDSGVTALIGPSGCGKTTLLKVIAGLLNVKSGEILGAAKTSDIAFLFQENRLLPGLSALKQIEIVLDSSSSQEITNRLLELADLSEARNLPPKSLSGGMQRRLSLVRALAYALDKKLLILDEPFSSIDPERSYRLMSYIRGLKMPVIMSAHEGHIFSSSDNLISFCGPPLIVAKSG